MADSLPDRKPVVSDAQIRLNYETRKEWSTATVVFVNPSQMDVLLKYPEELKKCKKYSYKVPGSNFGKSSQLFPNVITFATAFPREGEAVPVLLVELRDPTNEDLRTVSKRICARDYQEYLELVAADRKRLAEIEASVAEDVAAVELTEALRRTERAAKPA